MDGGKDFLELLSTHFLICNDKIIGNGEDCGYEAYTSEAGIMGAFDGCGGLERVMVNLRDSNDNNLLDSNGNQLRVMEDLENLV